MDYFAYCKNAYDKGRATADQLKVWVAAGRITAAEYQQITGQPYTA